MKTYNVTIYEYELRAMRELILYGRAIAQTLPDRKGDTFALKMKLCAQDIEEVIERIEAST